MVIANVRSQPNLNANILGVLVTGTGIQTVSEQKGWIKIKSPLAGWIAKSQIKLLPCDDSIQLLIERGLPTISRLGKQAINNNLSSEARENFTRIVNQLSLDNPVLQDWQYLNKKRQQNKVREESAASITNVSNSGLIRSQISIKTELMIILGSSFHEN